MGDTEQTTLLWDMQNQVPETVPLSQVDAKIKAGTHQMYEHSTVEQETTPGSGVTSAYDLGQAQYRTNAIGSEQALGEAGKRANDLVDKQQKEAFDTTSDALEAFKANYVKAMSLGFVDPTQEGHFASALQAHERQMAEEAHPWAAKGGAAAAIAVTLLPSGGESAVAMGGAKLARAVSLAGKAVEATPLGAVVKAQEAVTQAIRSKAIAAGMKPGILTSAATEAAGSAVGGALFGAGQQLGNVINGRPVSGDAIIDDIGLNIVLGGGLGLAGGAFGRAAAKIKAGKAEVISGARLDELMADTHAAANEAAGTWKLSHADSARRLEQLNNLAKEGALDGETAGKDWLAERNNASKAVDKAHKDLLKTAGVKDLDNAVKRVGDVLAAGNAKEVERMAVALGEYGNAVTKFEEAMRPTAVDYEHLLTVDAMDNLDLASHEDLGPYLQEYERMVKAGATDKDLADFARDSGIRGAEGLPGATPPRGENVLGEANKTGEAIDAGTAPQKRGGKAKAAEPAPINYEATAKTPMREFDVSNTGTENVNDLHFQLKGSIKGAKPEGNLPGYAQEAKGGLPGVEPIPSRPTFNGRSPTKNLNQEPAGMAAHPLAPENFGPGRGELGMMGRSGQNAFKAHQALQEGKFAAMPTMQSQVAQKIDDIAKRLVEASNGRLGTEQARELAKLLKVNMPRVAEAGPIAEKLVDMWSLKKLAEHVGAQTGKGIRGGKMDILGKSVRAGVVSQTRRMLPGGFIGGAAGYAMGGAIGSVIGGVGAISAIGGRMKNAATVGIAKALNPVGRKFLSFNIMAPEKISYDGSEPTRDFNKKADQLRPLAASPDALKQKASDVMADMGLLDPYAASAAMESIVRRTKNLADHLPEGTYRGPLTPPGPPDQVAMDNFHTYEQITHDREAIFQYIKAGSMPEAAIEAMREQHPDFLTEVKQYIIDNPDVVAKAPHQTKMALSALLGINLTQEADPLYVQRQQQAYIKAKEDAKQKQANQQGASMLRGGMPAPLPMTPAQQFTNPMVKR